MPLLKPLLLTLCLTLAAQAVVAMPDIRPYAREEARAARIAAEAGRLAEFRALARPVYMVRYPVVIETREPEMRPVARIDYVPRTRWEHRPNHEMWTRATMIAVGQHGDGLDNIVPRDIARWCPAYAQNPPAMRRAFWVGMMSALAKHESTWNPRAVGGGGLWYGLLQIYPDTARRYGCRARTGEALKNPIDNLSCAARIMATTVARDRAVALHDGRWRGVAADWGPMTNRAKIAEMAGWTARQEYCVLPTLDRPQARPPDLMDDYGPSRPFIRPAQRFAANASAANALPSAD